MNINRLVPRSGEPDASSISPLLGTNRVQSAVDHMAQAATKVAGHLTTASNALQRLATNVQRTAGNGSAGFGNGNTLSGGKQNGGGPAINIGPRLSAGTQTFMGMPSHQNQPTFTQSYGAPPPPPQGKGKGNGGWARYGATLGASAGYGMIDKVHENVAGMIGDNTAAQLMSRHSSMRWQDIRASIVRNNYTAVSSTDAMTGGATLMRAGQAIGSSGYNSLNAMAKNYRVMDPTATYTEAASRLTSFQSVGASNYLLGRGIGVGIDPNMTADQIIRKAGFSGTHKFSEEEYARQWGARGNATMLVNAVEQGAGKEAADQLRVRLQTMMKVTSTGHTMSEFDKAQTSGNWDALGGMGIKKTDLDATKDVAASKRNIEDDLAGGFSKGLSTATAGLEQFYNALGKVTGVVGGPLGFGAGILGSSGVASGIGSVGANVVGGYLGMKGLGWAAGRLGAGGLGSMLGGGAAGGGASAAAAAAAGPAAILAAAASLGGAAVSATTSDEERARRKKQLMAQGASDSWWTNVNAWSESFNNDMTLGLSDRWNEWTGVGSNEGEHNGPHGGASGTMDGGSTVVGGSGAGGGGVLPVGNAKVSAGFGQYPSGGAHYGIDYAVPEGTPVKAWRGGKVYKAGWDPKFGYHIRVDSGDGLYQIYGHLSKLSVREGATVKAGQVIAYSGSTGNSSGPHLHFEVRKGGKGLGNAVNPTALGGMSESTGTAVDNDPAAAGKSLTPAMGSALSAPWGVNEADLLTGALGSRSAAVGRGKGASGDAPAAASAGRGNGNLQDILAKAGFRGSALQTAYAIAMAESGGNAKAHNGNANTGDNSYGLFQINMLGGMGPERRSRWNLKSNDALFDPLTNARVAFDMSKHGTDWHDWSTYKNGSYKKYLGGQVKSYDVGSTNIDVDQIARVHKGEMILDPVTSDELRKALSTNTPTSVFGKSKGGGGIHIDKIEIFTAQAFTGSAATDLAKQFVDIVASHDRLQTIREG